MRLALLVIALLAARTAPARACDRAASPLEQPAVGLATADLVVIADIAELRNLAAKLAVIDVLKGDATAGQSIDVIGTVHAGLHDRCRGTPIEAKRRYLFALWKPMGASPAFTLVHAHAGVVAHAPVIEKQWRDALARPQPISAWRPQPSGLVAQLVLAPGPEVGLFVILRNAKTAPLTLDLKSWPRTAMSHCKLAITNVATKQRIAPKAVPIPPADIAKYFTRNPRAYKATLAPGESWVVRLDRITTAAAGWGYKEDLGFVFYPVAKAGDHTIAATCWNFIRRNSKIETGAITVPLSP